MREIKFRCFDPMVSKIISWEELCSGHNMQVLSNKSFNMMQYTGLKDKNGVEIYEGDILSPKDFKGGKWGNCVVGFKYDKFGMLKNPPFMPKFSDLYGVISRGKKASNEYEVIGNIHKNPELLESV